MFRSGLLHAFPSAVNGGTFQAPLQHLRKFGGLHNRLFRSDHRRGTLFGTSGPGQISGLPRNKRSRLAFPTALSFQNSGHDHKSLHARRRVLRNKVSAKRFDPTLSLKISSFLPDSIKFVFSFAGGFSKAVTWPRDTIYFVASSTFPRTSFGSTNPSKENSR